MASRSTIFAGAAHFALGRNLPLLIGIALFAASVLVSIVQHSQVSEDAAHSPLIIAIAAWLLVRRWSEGVDTSGPGSLTLALTVLLPVLALYVIAQWLGWVTIAGYCAWAALVAVGYGMRGLAALRQLWFPIAYALLALPLPRGTTVALTHDLRLALSDIAVRALDLVGYPVARAGVTIFVDRYELLVEEACSGLNSMVSLTSIGLFYVYVRHGPSWRYIAVFATLMILVALVANLLRVMLLMLITFHFGTAGLTLFAVALAGMFALDWMLTRFRAQLAGPR
jgi:exosortase